MNRNSLIAILALSAMLGAGSCLGDEQVPAAEAAPAAQAAEQADPVVAADPLAADAAAPSPETAELASSDEAVSGELVAPDPLASSELDELSLSNAVVVAAAVARAQEEVRATAAAEAKAAEFERSERERIAAEAKLEAALARRRISTRTFHLAHASAEEVAEKLNTTWSGDFGVVWKINKMAIAFPESNSIMVTAPAMILEACEQVIREVDVEPRQVYIEARFVELSNNAFRNVGIDWSMLDGMKGSANIGAGINGFNIGKGVQSYERTVSDKTGTTKYTLAGGTTSSAAEAFRGTSDGSITHFNGTLNFPEMYIVLSALEQAEDARIFSNPKIIVSSGRKAVVDMTTKYPNVTVSAKRTLNGNAESLDLAMNMTAIPGKDTMMFANEAFFSWGISLEVTPRIGTNGLINVSIVPTISNLDTTYSSSGFVTADDSADSSSPTYSSKYPVIEVQRLVTDFAMSSGTTAVIGGLSRTEEVQVDNGIPFLSAIPWIGPRLFGSSGRKKQQKEIIVFVTVGIIDPKDVHKDAGLPKNAVLGRQYTKGQKLEPGDKPEKNLEGIESLDLRSLEEQAQDPLPPPRSDSDTWIPFIKEKQNNRKEKQ